MKQLELLKRQREAARDHWQAERLRAGQEADADAQNRRDSREAEEGANAGRDHATKLVETARSAREKGRGELEGVGLAYLLVERPPSLSSKMSTDDAERKLLDTILYESSEITRISNILLQRRKPTPGGRRALVGLGAWLIGFTLLLLATQNNADTAICLMLGYSALLIPIAKWIGGKNE